jgi:hypothetical protein
MQEICIVRECQAEARHEVRSSNRPGLTFATCTYHASGVYVHVGRLFGGTTSLQTSFGCHLVSDHHALGSRRGRHELAG